MKARENDRLPEVAPSDLAAHAWVNVRQVLKCDQDAGAPSLRLRDVESPVVRLHHQPLVVIDPRVRHGAMEPDRSVSANQPTRSLGRLVVRIEVSTGEERNRTVRPRELDHLVSEVRRQARFGSREAPAWKSVFSACVHIGCAGHALADAELGVSPQSATLSASPTHFGPWTGRAPAGGASKLAMRDATSPQSGSSDMCDHEMRRAPEMTGASRCIAVRT